VMKLHLYTWSDPGVKIFVTICGLGGENPMTSHSIWQVKAVSLQSMINCCDSIGCDTLGLSLEELYLSSIISICSAPLSSCSILCRSTPSRTMRSASQYLR
jgi:hypothetical protein